MDTCPELTVIVSVDETYASEGHLSALVDELRSIHGVTVTHKVDRQLPLEGAKGLPEDTVLAVSGAVGLLTAVASVARAWLKRQSSRRLTLEIDGERLELVGLSTKAQEDALGAFVARHLNPATPVDGE